MVKVRVGGYGMFKRLALAWYRWELAVLNAAYTRLEKIKDHPRKDGEARLGSAVMMTEMLDRKSFLEKKLGIA